MVLLSKIVLVTRNARDKIQIAIPSLNQDGNFFVICRLTGQYQGKMTKQPDIVIEKGKAKRTALQQAELEFNSIVNKYLDKGYKRLDSLTSIPFEDIKSSELDKLVPTLKTDQSGNVKPMLAKDYNNCQNSVLQKKMYASRKLNGVRMMIKFNHELKKIVTISRGGKNYDISSTLIIKELEDFFTKYPDIILDGELYIHGKYLQYISGLARLETWNSNCEQLEYWIYDIASDKLIFEERLKLLESYSQLFNDNSRIKILKHIETNSWNEIEQLHNKWVSDGFEGVVLRKPDKVYEFGKRGSTMIKVKMYKEDEFVIVDYSEKLRDEDFCFVCQTKDGKLFEAKPIGTREMKDEYLNDIDNIIGKMGTIKFFEYSKDGIPLQPVFQTVRYDLDD